ncbi:DNA-3-methyladenine glycosylase family protein [Agrobacterium tumefaciens]|jgi:DNA-3-methyladenine glycosylase II|uniref:DNA-3-methyladenine glycosylase family protein n=1 Tax=Agrobacterium tumefaciens TaxID=358 RepID=UPI0021CDFBDD|nr:DNA-3-methyladenine glycosylase [Agrobacterium tumefaciens]UXS26298.1 DNA-3-methyladenine glycosylase 2 family protein [Agrobacterium tumefaciens]UXS55204.1 DNA-3-methyladenine glycosylase 2 family protein [Agrobacterium tumefaciens]UXS64824.1 DNA-3-methyladenine glycosylase 2 family protein [Agrobacterium tumefaciens]
MTDMKIITGMDDISEGLEHLAHLDPVLSPVIEKAGPLELRIHEPGFAGLAHIVVSQMVSRASANAIWARILAGTGGVVTAENYLGASEELRASFGLSRAKATTLEGLARAVTERQIDLDGVVRQEAGAAFSELVALRGIGPWTAEVYLMFCGGHPDIFPVGDVALRSAVAHALALEVRPEAKWLAERAALWSPWRSVAARLFWGYYANIMRRAMVPLP